MMSGTINRMKVKMASLALAASLVVLSVLLSGPITYLLAKIGVPSFIVYLCSIFCIVLGIWFCTIALPIWYIGLLPMYCGYSSIKLVNARKLKKIQEQDVDNR